MTDPTAEPQPNAPEPKSGSSVLRDRDGIRDALAALIGLARRDIVIFTPQMDAHFFNGAAIGQALTNFVRQSRHNRARIMVENGVQTLRDNARLVSLVRRFSDFIQMRQVSDEYRGHNEMFVIVDGTSYMHQQDVTKTICILEPTGRQKSIVLRHVFEPMWDRSEPPTGLHTAGLTS